jgi:hypothetical protein
MDKHHSVFQEGLSESMAVESVIWMSRVYISEIEM